jgi:hypothetical protein
MAKSKWADVEGRLSFVEKWASDGLTEKQIATNLRISVTTLELYKRTYPQFMEAIKRGRFAVITEVENALKKRALGFTHREKKTYIKYNDDGSSTRYQEESDRYFPPDVAACSILLKNKDKDEAGNPKWSDNPGKQQLDRELAEFKKEMERMRQF